MVVSHRARPRDNDIVFCEERPGRPYGSSCHSPMRWNGSDEHWTSAPDVRWKPSPDDDPLLGG